MNGMSLDRLGERFSSENLVALNVLSQINKINQIIILYKNVDRYIRYLVIL